MQATAPFPLPVSDDARLLAGLRAREAAGFTDVYAVYGVRLYDYAVWLLHDPVAAEDAVLDALLVAVDRAGRLPAPERFGAWLYALTRNECLRRLRRTGQALAVRPDDDTVRTAPVGMAADGLAADDAPEWIRKAAAALDARQREALDLALRHALAPAQLALVLGVSGRRVAALVAGARDRLQRAAVEIRAEDPVLGVCAELRALLVGRDGPLPAAMIDMVGIHRAICAACGAASRGEVHAAQVFAEIPAVALPPGLHSAALRAATVPSRVSARGEMAEPFRRSGFPVSLERRDRRGGALLGAVLTGAAAAVAVVVALGWFVVWPALDDSTDRPASDRVGTASPALGTPSSLIPSLTNVVVPTWRPLPNPTASAPTPKAKTTTAGPRATRPRNVPVPRPPADTGGGRGTGRPAQVDALLADATVGCPSRWRARATVFLRFNVAREVTFIWGENANPNRRVRMLKSNETLYEADITGLPLNRTVHWQVVAVTVDGHTTTTPVTTIRHDSLCRRRGLNG